MAKTPDKRIGELPAALGIDDDTLLAAEQQGIAVRVTGRQFRELLKAIFEGEVGDSADTGGVMSFNGRTGVVKPQNGDYTAEMVGAVPTTRTINGMPLTNNIILTLEDLGITGLTPGGGFIEMETSIPVSSRTENTLYGLILQTY